MKDILKEFVKDILKESVKYANALIIMLNIYPPGFSVLINVLNIIGYIRKNFFHLIQSDGCQKADGRAWIYKRISGDPEMK